MVGTRYVGAVDGDTGVQMKLVGAGGEGNFFFNQYYDYDAYSFEILSTSTFLGVFPGNANEMVSLELSSLDFTTGPLTSVGWSTSLIGVSVTSTGNSVTFSWIEQSIPQGSYLRAEFFTNGGTVPEPGSMLVWGVLGLASAGMTNRRRKSYCCVPRFVRRGVSE